MHYSTNRPSPTCNDSVGSTSAASLIPVGGQAAGVAKITRGFKRLLGFSDEAAAGAKAIVNAGDAGKALRGAEKLGEAGGAAKKVEGVVDDAADEARKLAETVGGASDAGKQVLGKKELIAAAKGAKARKLLAQSLGSPNYPVPAQAHHILGVELFDGKVAKKLRGWGIDLNSKANGVWLPRKDYPGRTASIHSGRSSQAYNQYVEKQLEAATSKDEALGIIEEIRQSLLSGNLKINNATGQ